MLIGLRPEPQVQQPAASEVFMVKPAVVEALTIQRGLLNVHILRRIVVGYDLEAFAGIILRIELNGHFIELRRGNFANRLFGTAATQAK